MLKLFSSSQTVASPYGRGRALPSGAHFKEGSRLKKDSNDIAYFGQLSVTKPKSFTTLAPGASA
jgi:hypothetical protein